MIAQNGGGGIQTGSSTVPEGGTIEIEVQNGATELEVYVHGDSTATTVKVPADGKVSIPVPAGATNGRIVTVLDKNVPPNSVSVEVVSSGT
jgi:hypothetical protein